MPINVNDPEYVKAEKEYYGAGNLEEKLSALRKMISHAPKHKGGENLRQQLTTRRKKLEQEIIKKRKSKKASKSGIKKETMQAAIIGQTNAGKSSLLAKLTNASPQIAEYSFSTKKPHIGIMFFEGANIQIIDIPAIESEYFEKGVVNNSDLLLLVVTEYRQIKEIEEKIEKATKNRIIVLNKIDLLSEEEKRKINATLCSKKQNFALVSSLTGEGLENLKGKIFKSFDKIRVYTKEPGKEKSEKPIILEKESTARDVAEKILKGFAEKVKETKIWGPSSKFPGQKIGLNHKLADLDVLEFKTK